MEREAGTRVVTGAVVFGDERATMAVDLDSTGQDDVSTACASRVME